MIVTIDPRNGHRIELAVTSNDANTDHKDFVVEPQKRWADASRSVRDRGVRTASEREQ